MIAEDRIENMKRALILFAVVTAILALSVGAFSAVARKGSPAKTAPKMVSAVCPVMGTKIPDVSKAAGKSIYKGKTYYFCCPMCKPQFDKNPEKYIKKSTPSATPKTISAVCPVMGTKIPDVRKASGKSVYKGKTYYFCCPMCKPQFDKNPTKYTKK